MKGTAISIEGTEPAARKGTTDAELTQTPPTKLTSRLSDRIVIGDWVLPVREADIGLSCWEFISPEWSWDSKVSSTQIATLKGFNHTQIQIIRKYWSWARILTSRIPRAMD